jgi:hypothetical protein
MKAKIVFSGWGKVDPIQPLAGEVAAADIDVAFAQAMFFDGRLTLRLGRQLIIGGGARNLRLDGANAEVRIWRGLGASAWAGAVVTPRYALVQRADFATGGRVFYRFTPEMELGASFVMIRDRGGIAQENLGIDGRAKVMRDLTVSAYALWSLAAARLAEVDVRAIYRPHEIIQLAPVYRPTAPDLFISRMSIFSVFAEESRDELGGEVVVSPHRRINIDGNGYYIVTASGPGFRTSGRFTLTLGEHRQTTVGTEVAAVRILVGFVQTRLFATTRIADKVTVTLDLDNYVLSRPLNGQTISFTAAATLGYQITPALRATVAASGGVTPFLSQRFEAMAKLTYLFAAGGG